MSRFADWVAVGIYYVGCGVHDYATWSTLMIADVGPEIQPHLAHIWEWSHKTAKPSDKLKEGLSQRGSMPKSILVVDDEPNILLSLEFLMKKEGYAVRTASDGEEALEAIREMAPDLVLLDIMMPRLDGFEVCQRIRANPEWKDIRIVILTAKGREVDQEKGLALGADDYITKPFSTRGLVEKVRMTLDEDAP